MPFGYTVVTSPFISSPAGSHVTGSATCPAGTLPSGGGVLDEGGVVQQGISSSYPSGASWVVSFNNASTFGFSFEVRAVCITPVGNTVVTATATVPAMGVKSAVAKCAAPNVALGGGISTPSTNLAVDVNSLSNFGKAKWYGVMVNGTTVARKFTVYAICGGLEFHAFKDVDNGPTTPVPPGQQTAQLLDCPVVGGNQTYPLSGGAVTGPTLTTYSPITLDSSFPTPKGWENFENNGGTLTGQTMGTTIVCADD
jgi:hypothetical protein